MDTIERPESSAGLFAAIYENLRRLAAKHLAGERPDHTLQATSLVHELFLKLAGESRERWNDPAHFFNTAASAMRQVLVDHARAHNRDKRGGDRVRVPLTEVATLAALADDADPADVLNLDAAITRLEKLSPGRRCCCAATILHGPVDRPGGRRTGADPQDRGEKMGVRAGMAARSTRSYGRT